MAEWGHNVCPVSNMSESKLRLEWRDAADLKDNDFNWRTHPESQLSALKDVIGEVGWAGAALYNEQTGRLIDGHARKKINNGEKIPVLVGSWTEEQEKLILATLDPLANMAEADQAKLDALIGDIESESGAINALMQDLATPIVPELEDPQVDNSAEELQEKWGTAPGQLWAIEGKQTHRLICGDSTSQEIIDGLMNGQEAVLCATDPPYGVNFEAAKYTGGKKKWDGISNDDRQGEDLRQWLCSAIVIWKKSLSKKAAYYFWTAAMQEGAAAAIRDAGLHIQSQVIWVKDSLSLGQADYQWRHENCWYAFEKGEKHYWYGGRKQTTVWEVAKIPSVSYQHPMQKPVSLYERPIVNHTMKKEVVFDPFLGSGTQLVAAEQLDRRCYGAELSPQYVAVCLERMTLLNCECRLVEDK